MIAFADTFRIRRPATQHQSAEQHECRIWLLLSVTLTFARWRKNAWGLVSAGFAFASPVRQSPMREFCGPASFGNQSILGWVGGIRQDRPAISFNDRDLPGK